MLVSLSDQTEEVLAEFTQLQFLTGFNGLPPHVHNNIQYYGHWGGTSTRKPFAYEYPGFSVRLLLIIYLSGSFKVLI